MHGEIGCPFAKVVALGELEGGLCSYELDPDSSLASTSSRFLTFIDSPKNNHKNYKYDVQNGPSTNLPLVALCVNPVVTW